MFQFVNFLNRYATPVRHLKDESNKNRKERKKERKNERKNDEMRKEVESRETRKEV